MSDIMTLEPQTTFQYSEAKEFLMVPVQTSENLYICRHIWIMNCKQISMLHILRDWGQEECTGQREEERRQWCRQGCNLTGNWRVLLSGTSSKKLFLYMFNLDFYIRNFTVKKTWKCPLFDCKVSKTNCACDIVGCKASSSVTVQYPCVFCLTLSSHILLSKQCCLINQTVSSLTNSEQTGKTEPRASQQTADKSLLTRHVSS